LGFCIQQMSEVIDSMVSSPVVRTHVGAVIIYSRCLSEPLQKIVMYNECYLPED
jgi:hypothetical protein